MASTREKVLSYRRAEWIDAPGFVLETCVRDAIKTLKDVADRTVWRSGQVVHLARVKSVPKGGVLLHITADTPGESASVVPQIKKGSEELHLKTAKAPLPGEEWLDGDAFVFIKGDDVCLCTTSLRDASISYFLQMLFDKAKLNKDAKKFILAKIANTSKLKLLHQRGVKEIEIRATTYDATARYLKRKSHVVGAIGEAIKAVKAFLGRQNDANADGLRVALTIKTDGRSKALTIGEKEIKKLAADIVQNPDDEDYVIVTNDGQKITPSEIFMKSVATIKSDGKTVNCDHAWAELQKFHGMLDDSGILEGG